MRNLFYLCIMITKKNMNILKFINIYVFLVSLAIGIFAVYITTDDKRIIYVYPTHENSELLKYRDKSDNCFQFEHQEVPCPEDKSKISVIPVQS